HTNRLSDQYACLYSWWLPVPGYLENRSSPKSCNACRRYSGDSGLLAVGAFELKHLAPGKCYEVFSKRRNPAQALKFAIEQRYNLCYDPMDIHAIDTQ